MANDNYFNLLLNHKVVKDFNDDHQLSIKLYQSSYAYLESQTVRFDKEKNYPNAVEFYRELNNTHAEMSKIFTDLFISYYAFRKAAETSPEINTEFKKLPKDFSPVEDKFNTLMEGYGFALQKFREAI